MAKSVHESADTLIMETDPTRRMPRLAYILRYQNIAQEEATKALDEFEETRQQMGESEWQHKVDKDTRARLEVLRADVLLTKDNLIESIRYDNKRCICLYARQINALIRGPCCRKNEEKITSNSV